MASPPWEQAAQTPPWEQAAPSPEKPEVTIPQPSLAEKIGGDLSKRYHNELNIAGANVSGKDSLMETVGHTLGQGYGAVSDVAGDVAGSLAPGFVSRGAKAAKHYIADSAPGRGMSDVGTAAGELAAHHPRTASMLGDIATVAGGKTAIETGKAAVPAVAGAAKLAAKGAKDLGESGAGKGITASIPAKQVHPEIAKIVRDAEKSGIKVPTAGLLPKGGILAEHANVSGMPEYVESVNKKAADLIGANESGGKFTTVNEAALNAASKKTSEDFDKVAKDIGQVTIGKPVAASEKLAHDMHGITPPETTYSKLEKIVSQALPSDRPAWKRIIADAQSKIDSNGKINASSIKQLISYGSDLSKKARSNTSDAGEAQKVISILKGALYDAASPAQKIKLTELDHQYKLQIAFDKAGARLGGGQNLTPEKIRDIIDSAYKESGENQYPARELKALLDTLHPPTGANSPIQGLSDPKLSAGIRDVRNPLSKSVTGRVLEFAPSKVSSAIVNRPSYREKLLGKVADAPEAATGVKEPLALPAPPKDTVIDSQGKARVQTAQERDKAILDRQRDKELGISTDIRKVISERLNDAAWNDMTQQQQERVAQEMQKAWLQNKTPIEDVIKAAKDFAQSIAAAKGEKPPSGPMSQIYEAKPGR